MEANLVRIKNNINREEELEATQRITNTLDLYKQQYLNRENQDDIQQIETVYTCSS